MIFENTKIQQFSIKAFKKNHLTRENIDELKIDGCTKNYNIQHIPNINHNINIVIIEDGINDGNCYLIECLNSLSPSNLLPFNLALKVKHLIMLLQNISSCLLRALNIVGTLYNIYCSNINSYNKYYN